MSNSSVVALVSLAMAIGSGIGFGINSILNYFQGRRDRKDKYFFALLEMRFAVHQQAYKICRESIPLIHGHDDERDKFTSEWEKWYIENCLYISPELRTRIKKNILEFTNYPLRREDWQYTAQKGDLIESERKADVLRTSFTKITDEILKNIENEMKIYYDTIK